MRSFRTANGRFLDCSKNDSHETCGVWDRLIVVCGVVFVVERGR